jgi:hypothetical protein
MGRDKKRKYRRFQVQKGGFVLFGSLVTELGQITDISRRGLAFRYLAHGNWSNRSSELVIYLADKGFYLGKVPSETIWDHETVDQFPLSFLRMRHRGVRFGELTRDQKRQIRYFLRNHTSLLEMRRFQRDRGANLCTREGIDSIAESHKFFKVGLRI